MSRNGNRRALSSQYDVFARGSFEASTESHLLINSDLCIPDLPASGDNVQGALKQVASLELFVSNFGLCSRLGDGFKREFGLFPLIVQRPFSFDQSIGMLLCC